MWTDQCHSLVGLFCYIILEKVFSLFLSCRCGVRFFFFLFGGVGGCCWLVDICEFFM